MVGKDLWLAKVAALTRIFTCLRHDATNSNRVGATGDGLSHLLIATDTAVRSIGHEVSVFMHRAVNSFDTLLKGTPGMQFRR